MHKDRHFLLIPGFMCDASLWQLVLPALEQRGHVQLADLNQGDSIESMAQRIQATAPAHAIVIGFSLGGYVARHLAWRLSTQAAGTEPTGLVLLNTSARASTEEELRRNQQQIRMLAAYPYKGQTMTALRRALHPQRQDDTAMLAHLHAMSVALGKEVFLRQLAIQRGDGHHELPLIRCPALVVASRNDQMRSLEESEKLAHGLPHAELQIIEDCGHMSPLEKAPELIVSLDQWLKQNGL
ncbi:alpha/beta fold hydrolase [Undibacterium sp. Ji49W]|uniref:alpha/beta fold hydrolase n=1 Tax=Undibacterium sp. Ji49W TaxID=3413040 RepID=UPI003BF12739